MSIIRPFEPTDILKFNAVNADSWTATYHNGYYASYAAQWPEFCVSVESAFQPSLKAYMLAKHEPAPPDPQHHGHLTALSISPPFRSLNLARVLMNLLERLSGPEEVDAWFVDLFVRCNNVRAIEMYERMGYSVFRRVVDYYSGSVSGTSREELDGFDMRKSMPKDTTKRHTRSNGRDILVSADQVWA